MSREALDSWLEEAELVLQEQAERAISPSSDPSWASEPLERTVTIAQLADDLERESAWDPRRLHTLEVRMEHDSKTIREAVSA